MGSPRVQAHFMDVPQRNFQKLPAIRGWVAPAPQGKGLLASMQRHLSHPPPHGSGSPNNDGMLAPAMRASLTGGGGRVSSQGQSLSAMLAAQRQVSSSYAALAEGVVSAANEATRGAPPSRSMPGGTSTSGSVPGGNVLARQVAQSSREDEGAPPPPLVVGPAHTWQQHQPEGQVTRDGTGTGTRAAGGRAEPEHAPGGKGRGREGTTRQGAAGRVQQTAEGTERMGVEVEQTTGEVEQMARGVYLRREVDLRRPASQQEAADQKERAD
eukprot:jgi/Mesen1/1191/ME001272S00368